MDNTTLYMISGAVLILLVICFVISKVVGCGFKIIKALILIAIIGLVLYGAKTIFIH